MYFDPYNSNSTSLSGICRRIWIPDLDSKSKKKKKLPAIPKIDSSQSPYHYKISEFFFFLLKCHQKKGIFLKFMYFDP